MLDETGANFENCVSALLLLCSDIADEQRKEDKVFVI